MCQWWPVVLSQHGQRMLLLSLWYMIAGRWVDHSNTIWVDSIQHVSWRADGGPLSSGDSADPHCPPFPVLPPLGGARKLRD